jgi:hypothetical protein
MSSYFVISNMDAQQKKCVFGLIILKFVFEMSVINARKGFYEKPN